MWTVWFLSVLSASFLLTSAAGAQTETKKIAVQNGHQVSLEYTLTDEGGKEIESNKGKKPFSYAHGQKQVIRGLEKGLEGMGVGEQKTLTIKAEDAYGPVNPNAFKEIPHDNIPRQSLKVDALLIVRNAQGQSFRVRVHEVKEKTVVLDFNHPLAGKTLTFDVTILAIEPVQKQ
ncbi:MAG: peptidylprolyl isomerase [Candidatus Binatia bacterium]